ncbi:hypothetical protein [Stieleria neptunia]|uniref:hypothetical protein n=1 Tax=Stieleria neptunia TaxID=2527979 RepID=UPI0011A345FA|nr:hypothetical protein [Stieleria neptunia]
MSLNPLALVEKLITEHGSAAIQKTHLELLKTQLGQLQSERDDLASEVASLRDRLAIADANVAQLTKVTEFVSKNGVLWKPDGTGFEHLPYCPTCEIVVVAAMDKFLCNKCGFLTNKSHPPARN